MKVHLGPFELEIEIEQTPEGYVVKQASLASFAAPAAPAVKSAPKARDYAEEVEMLLEAGFPEKTLIMIANNVLGIPSKGETLTRTFGQLEKAAGGFLTRPLSDKIWAIYFAPLQLSGRPMEVMAMGLNDKNQLIILGMEESGEALARGIVERGVDPKKVDIIIASMHLNDRHSIQKVFPDAKLQLDWQEFIDVTFGIQRKEHLKAVRNSKTPKEVISAIKEVDGPRELLTYLDYPETLWRALQATSPIRRLEKDVNSKTKRQAEPGKRSFIEEWSILRLQFQWLKVPVDAPALANLKYIKANADLA